MTRCSSLEDMQLKESEENQNWAGKDPQTNVDTATAESDARRKGAIEHGVRADHCQAPHRHHSKRGKLTKNHAQHTGTMRGEHTTFDQKGKARKSVCVQEKIEGAIKKE